MQDISVCFGKCTVKFVILSNGLASKFVYGIEGCSSERKKIVSLIGEYVGANCVRPQVCSADEMPCFNETNVAIGIRAEKRANTVRPYSYRLLGFTGIRGKYRRIITVLHRKMCYTVINMNHSHEKLRLYR